MMVGYLEDYAAIGFGVYVVTLLVIGLYVLRDDT